MNSLQLKYPRFDRFLHGVGKVAEHAQANVPEVAGTLVAALESAAQPRNISRAAKLAMAKGSTAGFRIAGVFSVIDNGIDMIRGEKTLGRGLFQIVVDVTSSSFASSGGAYWGTRLGAGGGVPGMLLGAALGLTVAHYSDKYVDRGYETVRDWIDWK
jgi:hypothetical protein